MSDSDYRRVEQAIRYLDLHATEQPRLADVASHVGLSEFHFQRLFRRWAGITPKGFLQTITLARAKKLLSESYSLLETSMEVGLSGTSRLHDLFLSLEAMTPGEYKRAAEGVVIEWGVHATPFGDAMFAVTPRGLCGLSFLDGQSTADALAELRSRWPRAVVTESSVRTRVVAREVVSRMHGNISQPLSLLLVGSSFQTKVWQALLTVPEGRVVSYAELARMVGTRQSSRAVGSAVAANPIGYLIPCHRVIRSTGALGNYHWGAARKEALLGVEGARSRSGRAAHI